MTLRWQILTVVPQMRLEIAKATDMLADRIKK